MHYIVRTSKHLLDRLRELETRFDTFLGGGAETANALRRRTGRQAEAGEDWKECESERVAHRYRQSVDDQSSLGFQALLGQPAIFLPFLIRRRAGLTLLALLWGVRCSPDDTIGFREFNSSLLDFGVGGLESWDVGFDGFIAHPSTMGQAPQASTREWICEHGMTGSIGCDILSSVRRQSLNQPASLTQP